MCRARDIDTQMIAGMHDHNGFGGGVDEGGGVGGGGGDRAVTQLKLAFNRETLAIYRDGINLLCDICSQLLNAESNASTLLAAGIQLQLKTLVSGYVIDDA